MGRRVLSLFAPHPGQHNRVADTDAVLRRLANRTGVAMYLMQGDRVTAGYNRSALHINHMRLERWLEDRPAARFPFEIP